MEAPSASLKGWNKTKKQGVSPWSGICSIDSPEKTGGNLVRITTLAGPRPLGRGSLFYGSPKRQLEGLE